MKECDENGNTPLHIAAESGHFPVVKSLIETNVSKLAAKNNLGKFNSPFE